MRWSCPHCGINLAVAEDKIGSGWAFSRCYKCGGFALIRRAEVNIIKVDKAPAGEHILLPEASDTPVMSREATQNLEKIFANIDRPSVRPANRRAAPEIEPQLSLGGQNPEVLEQAKAQMATAQAAITEARQDASLQVAPPAKPQAAQVVTPPNLPNRPAQPFNLPLPNPLPDVGAQPVHRRLLPFAIGGAGVMAIASGVYLYIQGQMIWEKARVSAMGNARNPIEQIDANSRSEVIRAPALAADTQAMVSDQLHQKAMAPSREAAAAPLPGKDWTIRARIANAKVRSGPGLNYAVVGNADPNVEYLVTGWHDRWFRISPREIGETAQNDQVNEMWIRNDLIELNNNHP